MMWNKRGILGIGLGMAGSGALLVTISMFVESGYWLLVTGSVFVVIGLAMLIVNLITSQRIDEEN